MQRLARSFDLRKPTEKKGAAAPDAGADAGLQRSPSDHTTQLGAFNLSRTTGHSLDDVVIEPILKLRGMDVFLTDNLENSVGTHPWLISHGLRSVPTLIINVMTLWGHILVYFEFPAWFEDWNSIVEEDSDADDAKAVKRFLKGDDEYRNQRLKAVPCLVEAPVPVKMLAPQKKEIMVQ